jgi:hypothetical protein
MLKPVRLELNNSGAWKLLARFDAGKEEAADAIMDAAEQLAKAINDPACGRPGLVALRISTDEALPYVLMRWQNAELGWRDARTGDPA